MNLDSIGNSTFHSSNTAQLETQESLYSYLKGIRDGNYTYGTEDVLYLKSQMVMMTFIERVAFISNYIKSLIVGNSLEGDLLRNMCDAIVSASYSSPVVSWDGIIEKCKFLNIDTTVISQLILESGKSIPIGASDRTIYDLTVGVIGTIQNGANLSFLEQVRDGALENIEIEEARLILMNLINSLGAGNNWSIDYIISLISQAAEEALAKINRASQLALNSKNSYKYSLIGANGDLYKTSEYGNLSSIKTAANLLLDEIYSASDSKVPSRLTLSASLSDILHSVNAVTFAHNVNKSQNELDAMMESAYACDDQLTRAENQLGSSTILMDSHLDMIDTTLNSCPSSSMSSSMSSNIAMLSKSSNKVPNSEHNLIAIGTTLVALKAMLDGRLSGFASRFFTQGGDMVSRLNSIINSLTGKLSSVIGPTSAKVVALIAKIGLAIAVINASLCIFKALMCAVGSLINTVDKAIETVGSYADKFSAFAKSHNFNTASMGNISDMFTKDTLRAMEENIRDGVESLSGAISGAISSLMDAATLDNIMGRFGSNCSTCAAVDGAYASIKSHVDELVISAYESVTKAVESGMKCPAMSIPKFSMPSLPLDPKVSLPSLDLKVGC